MVSVKTLKIWEVSWSTESETPPSRITKFERDEDDLYQVGWKGNWLEVWKISKFEGTHEVYLYPGNAVRQVWMEIL